MSKRTLTLWSSAAAILLCSAGAAIAGPGSDVIVGDIHEVQNNGQSGGMVSWSLGTVSCNKGDVPFQWLTSSNGAAAGTGENRHPVIGQNLFKVTTGANGTIRQLSQSWLKHGFTALQGNVCGFGCTAHPNGTYLGVGCSDPYSASLNAGQPNAGPKWEVNAATGVFPFPPFGKNTLTGNADKRLQVAPAQITAGALYFGECQYVAQDDATNNNKNNNASYRRVTIATTSPYSMDEVDSTVRERPGIYTWKDHGLGLNTPDANVLVSPIDVPGDGRFFLAVKVTQTSASVWHYEYAIHNLNSNRSGQQFRINFPAGTTITNTGFYNVPYHSGEPHSNTPWTIVVGADNITWSGPTYSGTPMTQTGPTTWVQPTGNDVTANALRWGTMYNFWFDANVGPTTADAPKGGTQLALFRPGSFGNAIQIAAPTPGSLTVGAPFNDNCVNPTPIGDGSWAFSTAGATSAGPNECTSSNNAEINQDIWYSYTAGASGNVTVSTCGSDYDTRLAVYSACPTAAGTALACNDDFNCDGAGADELQSRVTFAAVTGQTYLIRVGGYTNEYGNGLLTVSGPTTLGACCTTSGCSVTTELGCTGSFEGLGTSCTPSPCPGPANDSCANPIILSDGVPVTGTTVGATDDGASSCGSSNTTPDVWYAYTPITTGNVTFSTCTGTTYDTVISVHNSCPVGSTTNQIAAGGCDDDGCGTSGGPSSRQVSLTAGIRYLVRVTGYNGDTGAFTLRTTGGGGVAPPINDDCSGRIGVNAGVYAISNTGATTDGPAHATCSSRSQTQITKDLWYNFPATANGTLTVQVCAAAGSTIDPWVAIYDGYGCNDFATRLMGCNDQGNACSATNNAIITVPVVNTVSYTIRVGSYNNTAGNANMTITFTPTTGACCDSGTGCHLVATAADCTMGGGTYLGDNTLCVPDPCVPVTGACCVGTTCSVTTAAACTGTYHGNGSTCEGSALNPITCCPANVNGTDGVSADDIFSYLDLWFAQNGNTGPGHSADFNDNGAVNADDIFAFLDAWFAGCN